MQRVVDVVTRRLRAVPTAAFVVIALVVGSLFGHYFWGPGPAPDDGSDGVVPLPIDELAGRYVALGDSYSAGEGLQPWQPGTEDAPGDRCHRSADSAYPLLLTFVKPTETDFRACSGAVVANAFRTVQEHSGIADWQGLQVESDTLGDDVRLVTITMGGNDVDFAKVLSFCSTPTHASCSDDPYPEPGSPPLSQWVHDELAKLGPDLVDLYAALRGGAPNARIVVLGYPPLFPEHGPGESGLRSAVCRLAFNLFSASERELIRDAGAQLNATIADAAASAGVGFVDPSPYFAGHEPCGSNGEWVRLVDSFRRGAVRDGSFHPLAIGQAMFARIISCYVFLTPSPSTPATPERDYAMSGCVSSESVKVSAAPTLSATPTASTAPTISTSPSA